MGITVYVDVSQGDQCLYPHRPYTHLPTGVVCLNNL